MAVITRPELRLMLGVRRGYANGGLSRMNNVLHPNRIAEGVDARAEGKFQGNRSKIEAKMLLSLDDGKKRATVIGNSAGL